MSDSDARLKVTADTSGAVGPVDELTKAQQRAGDAGKKAGDELGAGYAKAAAAVDKFGAQAETGARSATRSLTLATVEVGKLEAEIARLKAQGQPTAALEAGLTTLRGKIAAGTDSLGRYKAAQADVADATRRSTQRAGEFSGSITDVTGTLKTMSPALADGIDKLSILAAKGFVAIKALGILAEGAKGVAQATGQYSGRVKIAIDATNDMVAAATKLDFAGVIRAIPSVRIALAALEEQGSRTTVVLGNLADASKADRFAGVLRAQQDLVQGHKAEVDALNLKAAALSKEIESQRAAGEVQKFVRDEIQKTLDGYVAAGEPIDAKLAAQAASLGIVATAQKQVAAGAQGLADTTVAAAETRAAAEEAAGAREVAALKVTAEARQKAVDDAQTALDKAIEEADAAEAAQFDSGAAKTNAEVEKLKQTVESLSAQPMLSVDQQNELNAARDKLIQVRMASNEFSKSLDEQVVFCGRVSAADKVLTAQRDLGIAMLERQQAAHDQVIDRLEKEEGGYGLISHAFQQFIDTGLKAGDKVAGTFSDAGAAASEAGDSVELLGDAAADTAGAVADVGTAATGAGEEVKKGFDGSKEAVGEVTEAVVAWNAAMLVAEATVDRIATKLANLQLGS